MAFFFAYQVNTDRTGKFVRSDDGIMLDKDRWLHTGDLAYKDCDGYFYISGRKKNVIIVGGRNIMPEEIETVLIQHAAVQEVYVYGLVENDEIVCADIVLSTSYIGSSIEEQLVKYFGR